MPPWRDWKIGVRRQELSNNRMELLGNASPITMLTYVGSSMLAVEVSLTVVQILAPLRNGKLVSLALLANFVIMPLARVLSARNAVQQA
jgi:BASS family bile acid:Na+ symporter